MADLPSLKRKSRFQPPADLTAAAVQPAEANFADTAVRLGKVRWTICALLFFATSINYLDRQVLGFLAPLLQVKIGWTEVQYGYIISGFQFAYAVGLILAGRMVDRVGSRIGYTVIMAVWTLASMGHALARTAFGFGVARFFLGLGESGNFPAAVKTTAEWFPQSERALATGIFNSGANLGAIIAPVLVPWVTLRYGWQAAFLVTGAFSAIWIAAWLIYYRRPGEHTTLSAEEFAHIHQNLAESSVPVHWKTIVGYRQTWAFSLAKFMTDPIWWFYLYWLPKFFNTRFHLDISHLGLPLIIIYTASAIGSISGGWLPAVLYRQGIPMKRARLMAMLLCAIVVTPIFFVNHFSTVWPAIAILSLAAAAHQGWSANLYTTSSDMFPRSAVGTVVGIGGMAGSVGGVLFSAAVGWVLQITHSYTLLFGISASAYLAAFCVLLLIAPGLKSIPAADAAELNRPEPA